MDDLIQEFLAETTESLNALDLDIVKLEQNPNDKDLISRIFRLVHTIKGTCGFLGLPRLETVAHRSENVLGRYRDGSLQVTQSSVSLILESFDRIKMIVAGIAAAGTEPEGSDDDLIARLDAVYEGKEAPPAPSGTSSVPAAAQEAPAAPPPAAKEEVPASPVATAVPPPAATAATTPASSDDSSKSLRVSVDVLENLMTMVSELVLTRNQLLQILRTQTDSAFSAPLQRLNHVVSDLQEGVMQTRMQPIGNAWGKLPRIIRDISVELGKKINLDMRGAETELDRQVLDLIKDPLTHMVRNSADHGIEKPAERAAAGKPEEGTVLLNAFHEGGHIIIEISDDGKGLNTDRIRAKAIEKGVATEEQIRAMTEQQIQQFIFAAGFSTAEKVTSVSGRGVGMDVVRTNIEKIGGTIEMKSVFGKGTTFTIKIPLTLAIVSALIVEAGSERYAVPQLSVRELVRLTRDGENKLEEIHGTPVMRLRDRLLPLVSLRKILRMEEDREASSRQVIVVQVGAQMFGIIVDRVFDTEEIVVKPVSPILKNIRIFSGNTILGDGSVIMILDPNGVASMMGDVARAGKEEERAAASVMRHDEDRKTSLLVFKAGPGAPRAVPLALVSRLEEFEVSKVETSGSQRVIQYRGRLMPLIPFSDRMQAKTEGLQSVLVFADRERSMGLLVDEIVDIVEEKMDVQIASDSNFGLLGSAIIHGQAMDVIDVGHFLSVAHSDWFGTKGQMRFEQKATRKRVLLVDDSPFFRNMLAPMLNVAGYQVVTAEDAAAALKICQSGEKFDVIVSDIEMPGMSGFEFAQKVRGADGLWKSVPMVALSSHATPQDLDRGRAAGFNEYIAKFDREGLLRTLAQMGEVA